MVSSAALGMADVRAGVNFLMPAYVAVFLGNAMFGRPSAGATVLGTLLIATMINGFTLLNVPFYYGDAIESIVLIVALFASNRSCERFCAAVSAPEAHQGGGTS